MRLLLLLLLLGACGKPSAPPAPAPASEVPFPIDERPLTQYVDPMIGTQGPGNVIPGALVPHGMVRLSPDTLGAPGDVDAYDYDYSEIEGFTHTNLEGPGGGLNGYSQLLVLPQTGALNLDPSTRPSAFSHRREVARPGYYAVTLDDYNVRAELSATGHAAIHRYRFPAGDGRLLIDLGHSLGLPDFAELTIDGSTLRGQARYIVHPASALLTQNDGRNGFTTLYFQLEVDAQPSEVGTWDAAQRPSPGATSASGVDIGAWLGFNFERETELVLKVGISLISTERAAINLHTEIGDRDLDAVASEAEARWNTLLNRVQAEGSDDSLTRFYTALYHSSFQPADYTEVGGYYVVSSSGAPVVRHTDGPHFFTDDWCMWDTFRTSHPWANLFEPELRDDIIGSMLQMHQEGGWLPKCSFNATGYSRVMTSNPAVSIIADAATQGLLGFDTALAWEAVDNVGVNEISNLPDGVCGYVNQGTPPDYLEIGYVPSECDPQQSAGMTLEHAYDDWAAARLAETLDRPDDAARYELRGQNWRNVFNPAYGFMQGRHRDGSWVEPFDPADSSDANNFVEASSWIYTFFVPQDIPGLIEAVGGKRAFLQRLDDFFAQGHFDPSNQPSFHIPWLYAAAGDPARTQAQVREVVDQSYGSGPRGLPGNDDAGSTSAWLVLAMLGIYPISPGDGVYTLSAPRLSAATLHLHPGYYPGGSFELRTVGDPDTMPFIASASWNGDPLRRPTLTHEQLVGGGVLELRLSAEATDWGAF